MSIKKDDWDLFNKIGSKRMDKFLLEEIDFLREKQYFFKVVEILEELKAFKEEIDKANDMSLEPIKTLRFKSYEDMDIG